MPRYSVGLDAVNGLRRGDGKNQAVLISGESGAGGNLALRVYFLY